MKRTPPTALIHKALVRHGFESVSDATLLVRYTRHRDADAFGELVNRYATLVWGVCRRACGDEHAAEDAFQATFLALSRQAASIRRPECLSAWLHGVARRNAWKARANPMRASEGLPDTPVKSLSPMEQMSGKELIEVVETEIARLPEKYRSAVLDCWFDDESLDAVARRIGVTKGVLWGRLKRGRELLQSRLSARGFGLPAVIMASVLSGSSAPARICERAAHEALRDPIQPTSTSLVGAATICKWMGGLGLATTLVFGIAGLFWSKTSEQPPRKPQEPQAKDAVVDDGFPMPAGAIHRFGNRQLRHADGIYGSAVSPDGQYLATLGRESVIVWDLKTLTAKRMFSGVRTNVYSTDDSRRISFTADSKAVLFTVSPDPQSLRNGIRVGQKFDTAEAWDIETGKKKFALQSEYGFRSAVWMLANGKEIALHISGGMGGNLVVFDAKDGKEIRTIGTGDSQVICKGDRNCALEKQDGTGVVVLDASTGKELASIQATGFSHRALSPDGKLFLWCDQKGMVHIFDLEAKKERGTFEHPEKDRPGPMLVSPDSKTLYFSSNHGRLFRWNLTENKKHADFANRHNYWNLSSIAVSPDESTLYSMAMDHLIKRWDLKTGKELPLPEGYTTQTTMVVDKDGKHLILSDHEGQIDYWNLSTGVRTKQLQPSHLGGLNCIAQSKDGRWLAGGRTGQDVRLFDLSTGKVIRDIPLGDNSDATKWGDPVQRVAFSADGKILFASSQKTGITAYEVPSGKQIWRENPGGALIALDPHGKWLAVGGGTSNEQVRWSMLDAKTGAVRFTKDVEMDAADPKGGRPGSPPYTWDLVAAPDGMRLITSHYDGNLREWDAETGKELRRIGTKVHSEQRLAISPDGAWLGVGGSDRSVTVWETATWKSVMKFAGHDSPVLDLAFTKDGRGLISGADLSPVLWSLVPNALTAPDANAWEALASDDGEKAYRAQWALIQKPEVALKLFREYIKPDEMAIDRAQFDKWRGALDHPQFRVREASEKELISKGSLVPIAWLRRAVADSKSDEQRARLERVLANREKLADPNDWRIRRVMTVLELAGTSESKQLLQSWAKSSAESPLADRAKAALGRLP